MALRLLKFDKVNPQVYIVEKIEKNFEEFSKMNRAEALDWIIATRANFSDFYTYNLRKSGWEAEEFFVNEYYIDKVADELYGKKKKFTELKQKIKNKIRPIDNRWTQEVIIDYVKHYKPDVILVREIIGIRSDFWRNFGNTSLLVSRLAAPIPSLWTPNDWDLILTSTEAYKVFFELNSVPSILNHNGFDRRIIEEIKDESKKYDVTFVGGMGERFWTNRTKCIEYIAGQIDFKWWGYNSNKYSKDNPIHKSFQGLTSGLEMLKIYKQSKIVFNDYGEVANGMGVNQRMFEVMGTGSLLLTRDADNFKTEYPQDIFVTFKDEKDCLDKIKYFLKNEKEREEIALRGHKYLMENFTYDKLMSQLSEQLKERYKKKFPDSLKLLS
jgi:hypothetical protein